MSEGAGGSVGILHPGEMGAALAAALRHRGRRVCWASAGRSPASVSRAADAGLRDLGGVPELLAGSAIVLSICPPAAAEGVAALVARERFDGVFVDCNAIAPATAGRIAARVEAGGAASVDGGIVGPPPGAGDGPRLYLSGAAAGPVAALFAGTPVQARVLDGPAPSASAMKMLYAAWTKGSAAMLLAIAAAAERAGLADELRDEWALSQPGLDDRLARASADREAKGWRWVEEMEEVASTLGALGQPAGFHRAAAEVFGR